jgi:hypothetical protein
MVRRAALAAGRQHTGDRQGDDVWRELRAIMDTVNGSPMIAGRLITEEEDGVPGTGLSFTGGTPRSIAHRLGRKARGFVEVYGADVPSSGHVGLRATAHPTGTTSETHITATSSDDGVCWLWVF